MTGSQFDIIMPILARMEEKIDGLNGRIDSLEQTRDEDIGAAKERAKMRKKSEGQKTFLLALVGAAAGVGGTAATIFWVAFQVLHIAAHA